MTPMQQMLLGVGAKKKTYLDDVFSTYLYTGNNGSQTANTGLNMSGEGGMVWVKNRSNSNTQHSLFDTLRGVNNVLHSESSSAQASYNYNQTFTSTGFTFNNNFGDTNGNTNTYTSWSFRKAPGYFTICSWTGNGSEPRQIAHDLGCMPGLIAIKNLSTGSTDWRLWHRDFTATQCIRLNSGAPIADDNNIFGGRNSGSVLPTSTYFEIGAGQDVNENGSSFIAYLWAGGKSEAATARSVDFDGSNDYLTLASSSDFDFGTGDFTIEAWCYNDGGFFTVFDHLMGGDEFIIFNYANGDVRVYSNNGGGHLVSGVNPGNNRWYHLAVVRESGKLKFYIDGVKAGATHNFTLDITQAGIQIGRSANSAYSNGRISNLRVVKGTAVYTSSFRPSTVPLTSISGTVLLCCNNSSVTGKTTGGTITAYGSPTASTDIPFDDPAGFVFGDSGEENLIKCGSYIGNGNADGPEINLGWEPQWILIKNIEENGDEWVMYDSMRGIFANENDKRLYANHTSSETSTANQVDLTPTGFKIMDSHSQVNRVDDKLIYFAVRRSDGYVGKPADAGTSVFTMDTGSGSSTIPNYDSGFPVDWAWYRKPASAFNWWSGQRLTGDKLMTFTGTNAEGSGGTDIAWDSNTGWSKDSGQGSDYQSWMFKRHAGFDVVAENNLPFGANIPHSLGKTPEMIIGKNRNNTFVWGVYHKGVNGGTNPEQYRLRLNTDDAQQQVTEAWNNTAPTATHFTVGANHTGNSGGADYQPIFLLFASVAGISSVGSYTGTGNAVSVTTGFQPRFYMIKRADAGSSPWYVVDSLRGMSNSGNEKGLQLESNQAQYDYDFGTTSSTGFTITATHASLNANGGIYIYYAHA